MLTTLVFYVFGLLAKPEPPLRGLDPCEQQVCTEGFPGSCYIIKLDKKDCKALTKSGGRR